MFKLLLIWRYFLHRRVALIAVLGVALLVMMVLIVLSVMSGLVTEARRHNHDWSGDLVLARDSLVGFDHYEELIDRLEQCPAVQAATPVIKTFAIMTEAASAVQLYGVRLGEFCKVTQFAKSLHFQSDRAEPDFVIPETAASAPGEQTLTPEQRQRGCIMGTDIYARRKLSDLVEWDGQRMHRRIGPWAFTVFCINRRGAMMGSDVGQTQTFWYVDDCITRLVDVDRAVLVDFEQLQRLCWMDGTGGEPKRTSEIRIKLADGVGLDDGYARISSLHRQFVAEHEAQGSADLLKDVRLQDWQQYRRSNIAPMEKEKAVMILVFAMIGVVAVFIVFAIFYMIVTQKVKDLGIVRSVGASAWGVGEIFLGYGVVVGLVGAVLGTALGWAIVANSNAIEDKLNDWFGFRLWPPDVYMIERIPDVVEAHQAMVIALVAVLASVAGAAVPAWRAARLQVVEALRVE